eukprot:scaffold69629_cov69-Phaeocystis_antarctica.AAC.5
MKYLTLEGRCSKEVLETALPPPADRICCTRLRHFVKLDLEAPVARYASASFNPGRDCCSSTACSALMVPTSIRVAPRAIPNVRTTRCTWIWSSATKMSRRAISRACSGVGTLSEAVRRLPVSSCEAAAAATDEVGCVPLVTGCHKRDGSRGWDDCRSCHATACRPGYAGALTLVAGLASRTG